MFLFEDTNWASPFPASRQWSRAIPPGARPTGRYGHTLSILGSKLYVFGGQVEGFFFNDLVAFDLNQLQNPTNKWELLIRNSHDGGPAPGQIPPARTNHTIVSYNDRLYLYGIKLTNHVSPLGLLSLFFYLELFADTLLQIWRNQRHSMVQRCLDLRSPSEPVVTA